MKNPYYESRINGLKTEETDGVFFSITKEDILTGEKELLKNPHKKRLGKVNPYYDTYKHSCISGVFIGIEFITKNSVSGKQETALLKFQAGSTIMHFSTRRNRPLRRFIECFPENTLFGGKRFYLVTFCFPGEFEDEITGEKTFCMNKGFTIYSGTMEKHNKMNPHKDDKRQMIYKNLVRMRNREGRNEKTQRRPLNDYLKEKALTRRFQKPNNEENITKTIEHKIKETAFSI